MFGNTVSKVLVALVALFTFTAVFSTNANAAPAAQASPITIVQEYLEAYNAGDIDKAVSYLADDVVFINPTGTYVGKAKARENLEAIKKDGITFEYSDFKDDNGRVVYSYKVIIGGEAVETGTGGLTIVKDGKIVFDGTTDTEKQLPTAGAESPINMSPWLALAGVILVGLGIAFLLRQKRHA
jgi:hypothetical protein